MPISLKSMIIDPRFVWSTSNYCFKLSICSCILNDIKLNQFNDAKMNEIFYESVKFVLNQLTIFLQFLGVTYVENSRIINFADIVLISGIM